MNAPINKPSVSLCSPIRKELENLELVSVLKLVYESQLLFDVAVTKELTGDLCSVNRPPLSSTEVYTEDELYLWRWRNSWRTNWDKFELRTPLHCEVMIGSWSAGRFYSQWPAYKLAYLLGQLSSAVSPWWLSLKGWNLVSPFICLCR